MSNYWSDKFNALPKETRHISCAITGEAHIRQIKSTIATLKRMHRKQIAELNEQIKNLESWQKSQFPEPRQGDSDE